MAPLLLHCPSFRRSSDEPSSGCSQSADLVDFAIDTDNGVIEAPDRAELSVLDGEFRYVYAVPKPPEAVEEVRSERGGDDGGEHGTEVPRETETDGQSATE